jgi:Na+-driven multidrug efflux pump
MLFMAIGASFSQASQTLVAQAFGAEDMKMARIYAHRQVLINLVLFGIMCTPCIFLRQIYTAMGQEPEVIAYALQFVHTVAPSFFF